MIKKIALVTSIVAVLRLRMSRSIDRSPAAGAKTIGNVNAVNFLSGDTGLEITGTRTFRETYQLESTGNVNQVDQVYNEEGQLTTSHWGSGFDWDIAGRMTEATVPANPGVGVEGTYNYGYDADGRRVWRKKQSTDEVTVFVYGGPNVISDVTIDVTTPSTPIVDSVQRYVYGTTIDELVMVEQDDDTELGVTRNGQWSVMSLYNLNSGAIQKRFNYGVFGQRYVVDPDGTYNTDSTADLGVPYGYTSRRHDAETGMMYFRARYYDPTTGEFISQDPLEYVDGMSLYRGYFIPAEIDPSGKQKKDPHGNYLGRIKVKAKDCSPEWLKQGCCCTNFNATYAPTAQDKAAYSRIYMDVFVRTHHERHRCWDYFQNWHHDDISGQTDWPTGVINAEWSDHPGGGTKTGCRASLLCPGICDSKRLKQDFEVCAIGVSAGGVKTIIGCVKYGHVCNWDYWQTPAIALFAEFVRN